MHCQRFHEPALTRREMLSRSANGFGALALAALAADPAYAESLGREPSTVGDGPLAERPAHFRRRATRVIFLFMDGGPSQVDTFDPKPRLAREHGQPIKVPVQPTQFDNVGMVLDSPWKFRQYGQSGIPVSELFPHVATCVDDLAIVRSMTSNFSEHTNANYFMHTGLGQQGRPSMGAWITYGLGSQCRNLPGFVVLNSGMIPPGGLDCFGSGFLPVAYQGSSFREGAQPVADLQPLEPRVALQQSKLGLLRDLDRRLTARAAPDDRLEAAIANYELAFRMQSAVPELSDITGETRATHEMYGLDDPHTQVFGRQCLLARRLIERGVRFIELLPQDLGFDRWDQHSRLKEGHAKNALATDKPIAALLTDLKARGLLDETLVVWGGEFGRTPMAQGTDGRDHNPFGFTMWLAGGGIRGGTIYGATDDYGYHAITDKVQIHDLHATMLHLLGVDHKRLTYRFGGRDMRLTDVHGEIIRPILS
ncbi:MAG TPA: DUF1501 domain-containing protein [Pirellulales bacterium]|jgi:hypothetical protein